MRPVSRWSYLLAAALFLPGCAQSSDHPQEAAATRSPAASASPTASTAPGISRIPVVASANFYGDLLNQIGGERVQVTSIITNAGQDPHSFEANTRTQLALKDARVVIKNGGHYDDFMNTLLSSVSGERKVIDAFEISGESAEPSATQTSSGSPSPDLHTDNEESHPASEDSHAGEEEEGRGHGDSNEHVWYDLAAMDTLAGKIADELTAVQPESREYFQANASTFRSGLSALRARQGALKAKYTGAKVAVTEPVPLYLIEACGLENLTPAEFSEGIEEGSDIPIRVLQETIDLMSRDKIKALVYNDQTTGPQTEQVRTEAERNGVPVVTVTETLPEGSDFLGWMGANLDSLEKALSS